MDYLIVGLGNPAKEYFETRHNIGWMVAYALCNKHNVEITKVSKYYLLATIMLSDKNNKVIFPLTYMNNSGLAVRKASERFNVPIERIIIVCDEYNFPLGRLHLKDSGGDGGHNGIASIIEYLKQNNFMRLRCGISRNFGEGQLVEYVLSAFKPEEIAARDKMIYQATEAIEYIIKFGKRRAMSDINSGRLWQ
ncbi:MAG: aminoacyl-tRNA hydrolase [Candidatus Kapaibacteriales bacterium]